MATSSNISLYEKILKHPNDTNLWQLLFEYKNNLPSDIDFNTLCLINNIKCYPAWNYRRRIRDYYEIEDEDFLIEILKRDVRNYHAWNYLQYLNDSLIEYIALYFFILDSSNYSARHLLIKDEYILLNCVYKELMSLNKNNEEVTFCDFDSKISIKSHIENLPRIYQNDKGFEIYFKELFEKIQFFKTDEKIFEHKGVVKMKFMRINTNFRVLECMKIKINNIFYNLKFVKENIFLINNQPCF